MAKTIIALACEYLSFDQNQYRRNEELVKDFTSRYLCEKHSKSTCQLCTALPRQIVCTSSSQMLYGLLPYVLSSPYAHAVHGLSREEFCFYRSFCPTIIFCTRLNIGWRLESFDELKEVLGVQDFVIGIRLSGGINLENWTRVIEEEGEGAEEEGEVEEVEEDVLDVDVDEEQQQQEEEEDNGDENEDEVEKLPRNGVEKLVEMVCFELPMLKTFSVDQPEFFKRVNPALTAKLLQSVRSEPIRVWVCQTLARTYFTQFGVGSSAYSFAPLFDELVAQIEFRCSLEAKVSYISALAAVVRPFAAEADDDGDTVSRGLHEAVTVTAGSVIPLLRVAIARLKEQHPNCYVISQAAQIALCKSVILFLRSCVQEFVSSFSPTGGAARATLFLENTLLPSGLLHVVFELLLLDFHLAPEYGACGEKAARGAIPYEFRPILASATVGSNGDGAAAGRDTMLDAIFSVRNLAADFLQDLLNVADTVAELDIARLLFHSFNAVRGAEPVASQQQQQQQKRGEKLPDNTDSIAGLVVEIVHRHVEPNPGVMVRVSPLWRKHLLDVLVVRFPDRILLNLLNLSNFLQTSLAKFQLRCISAAKGDPRSLPEEEILSHETLRDEPVRLIKTSAWLTRIWRCGFPCAAANEYDEEPTNNSNSERRKKQRRRVFDLLPRFFDEDTKSKRSFNLLPMIRAILCVAAVQLGVGASAAPASPTTNGGGPSASAAALAATTAARVSAASDVLSSPKRLQSPLHRSAFPKDSKSSYAARLDERMQQLPDFSLAYIKAFLRDLHCCLELENEFCHNSGGDERAGPSAFTSNASLEKDFVKIPTASTAGNSLHAMLAHDADAHAAFYHLSRKVKI